MESHEKKSDEAAADADRLAKEGDRVEEHIEEAKRDWEAKQGDQSVTGAVPDPGDEESLGAAGERDESSDSASR